MRQGQPLRFVNGERKGVLERELLPRGSLSVNLKVTYFLYNNCFALSENKQQYCQV